MLLLERGQNGLRRIVVLEEALPVHLAIGAGVRIRSRREEVRRNVADCGHVGHDLDLLFDGRELGEELRFRVALEDRGRDRVSTPMRLGEPVRVRLIEEDLGLEDVRRLLRDRRVVSEREVEEHVDRRPALRVGEQLEREALRDLRHFRFATDDLVEELSLRARGTRRARQRVVDEELERVLTVLVCRLHDVGDQLLDERGVVDRLGVQTLFLAKSDLVEVVRIEAHGCSRLSLDCGVLGGGRVPSVGATSGVRHRRRWDRGGLTRASALPLRGRTRVGS